MTDAFFAIALIIAGARVDLPPAELERRFEAACVDGSWAGECPALRTELEVAQYAELRELADTRAPLDRETLRSAAAAKFPPLAELGLRRLERIQSPEDRAVVLLAVEHASPAVRELARRQLEAAGDGWRESIGRWWRSSPRGGFDALAPDAPPPDLSSLGLPSLPVLRYRPFASGDRRAVFTTAKLSPDQLVESIGKGRKVFTGAQVAAAPKQQQALAASMEDVQKRIQAAMARGDFKAVQEIMAGVARQQEAMTRAPEALGIQPVTEFAAEPAAIRYVVLPAGKRGIPVTAAIGRDDGLGETVMVVSY